MSTENPEGTAEEKAALRAARTDAQLTHQKAQENLVSYIQAHTEVTQATEVDADSLENIMDFGKSRILIKGEPKAEELAALIQDCHKATTDPILTKTPQNILNGSLLNSDKTGEWLGNYYTALPFMALASSLGIMDLHTPQSMLGELCTPELEELLINRGAVGISVTQRYRDKTAETQPLCALDLAAGINRQWLDNRFNQLT